MVAIQVSINPPEYAAIVGGLLILRLRDSLFVSPLELGRTDRTATNRIEMGPVNSDWVSSDQAVSDRYSEAGLMKSGQPGARSENSSVSLV